MPTLSELIERVRAAAGDDPTIDTLVGSHTNVQTTITVTEGTALSDHERISIGLEEMYIQDKPTTTTATVIRGFNGSAATTHAAGVTVRAGYRFANHVYQQAINEALNAITHAFGRPQWEETSTFSHTSGLISVPSTAIRVNGLSERPTGYTQLTSIPFRLVNVPPSLFAAGRAVQLLSRNPGSGAAYLHYESRWTNLALLTDSLDPEFPIEAEDLILLGAIAFLSDREAFARMAYDSPHVRVGSYTSQLSDVRLAAREAYGKFLSRRAELAPRHRITNTTWLRG